MNKTIAIKLREKAEEVAQAFSQEREFNYTNEKFQLEEIRPLSETTACAIYMKSSGKKAVAFLYCIKPFSPNMYWCYFFPSESHCVGMDRFMRELEEIDNFNFNLNFEDLTNAIH